jgi:hypothetical protein
VYDSRPWRRPSWKIRTRIPSTALRLSAFITTAVSMSVPFAITRGRSEPARTSPIASIARWSNARVVLEFGEVVDVGEVDDPLRRLGARAQAVEGV